MGHVRVKYGSNMFDVDVEGDVTVREVIEGSSEALSIRMGDDASILIKKDGSTRYNHAGFEDRVNGGDEVEYSRRSGGKG